MKTRVLAALPLAAALFCAAVLPGCGPFWVDPYITVKESQLNWIKISYYRYDRKPVRRMIVYLNGAGHVEIRKGTSELVSNDFAKNNADENWSGIKTQRFNVDPKHINDIFQNLVNYGVLDAEKHFKGSGKKEEKRFIGVRANISNLSYAEPDNIFEADPDLAEQLMDVIREFDNPAW